MKTKFLKQVSVAAMCCSIAAVCFADDAPVYDVDSYSPNEVQGSDASASTAPTTADNAAMDKSTVEQQQPIEEQPAEEQQPPPLAQEEQAAQAPLPDTTGMPVPDRLARVEQQISNMQQTVPSDKIENLQNELQSLRGQVEEMTHQLQQMQAQQKNMYSDLDKRIPAPATTNVSSVNHAVLASAADVTTNKLPDGKKSKTVVAAKTSTEPNVLEEQQTYQTAYDLIKVKKYSEAIATLQSMLKKYPSGQFAANAHYWLGELYGLMGKNSNSAQEFSYVVKNFSNSPKVSDAQFKLGLISATAGNWSEAKSAFRTVINDYPGTTSARLASQQLKQMKIAGH